MSIVVCKFLCVLVYIFKIGFDVFICRSKFFVYFQREKNKIIKNLNNWIVEYSKLKKDVNLVVLLELNGNY